MRALNCSSVPPVAINHVLNLIWERFVGNGLGALDSWFDSLLRRGLALAFV
jgi:hypothetical protein